MDVLKRINEKYFGEDNYHSAKINENDPNHYINVIKDLH